MSTAIRHARTPLAWFIDLITRSRVQEVTDEEIQRVLDEEAHERTIAAKVAERREESLDELALLLHHEMYPWSTRKDMYASVAAWKESDRAEFNRYRRGAQSIRDRLQR